MALRDWVRNSGNEDRTVATIAKVAVANLGKQEPEPTDGRGNLNNRNSRNNRGSGSCKQKNEILYSLYTDSATDSGTSATATLAILATAPANRIEVDPWLTPCCICGDIEFVGAIFTDVESFWCVTCQVVPDGWIKRRRVNSPKQAMRKQAKRRSLPDARCKVCGKEPYGSIHGGRFCKACGAPCDESEPAIAPARAVFGGRM